MSVVVVNHFARATVILGLLGKTAAFVPPIMLSAEFAGLVI